jgi:hypothetical protein
MLFDFKNSDDNCLIFINNYFEIWSKVNAPDCSTIKKICMFKNHIVGLRGISPNDLIKILTFLNKICRISYLSKKYTKKWLAHWINKKEPVNTSDLELNTLDMTRFNEYINYIDYTNRQHYLFTIKDFTCLIYTNLENCYAYDIVPQPVDIKNPYTNNIFMKDELVDLHFKYSSRTDIPLIWHMYINCGYDVDVLREAHYDYLLALCIPSFVDKLEELDILYYLEDMFKFLSCTTFCKHCLLERKHFRDKQIRNVLIYWIRSIKLNQQIDVSKINIILKLYPVPCDIHTEEQVQKKKRPLDKSVLIKDIDDGRMPNQSLADDLSVKNESLESVNPYINFSYPFVFTMGTYTKKKTRRYKDNNREKNIFNKKLKRKDIL